MYIFPFIRIRYIKTITINTHIDCLNNSKCSVRDILLATKQGAFESVFGTFSVMQFLILCAICLSHCYGAPSDRPIGDPDVAWHFYHETLRSVRYAKLLLLPSYGGCGMFFL